MVRNRFNFWRSISLPSELYIKIFFLLLGMSKGRGSGMMVRNSEKLYFVSALNSIIRFWISEVKEDSVLSPSAMIINPTVCCGLSN